MSLISRFLKEASETGLRLPLAFDPDKGFGSVTMLFAYVSFFIALGTVVYLVIQDPLAGTTSAITLWTLTTVLYLMRRLNKFKADLKNPSIELDSSESPTDSKGK